MQHARNRRLIAAFAAALALTVPVVWSAGHHTAAAATTPSGNLIWTATDIAKVKTRIAAGTAPYAAAWSAFKAGDLAKAMSATASVVAGPAVSSGAGSPYDTKLGTDGSNARSAGIGYALTGTATYASKARELILAWAKGNHPSTVSDMGDTWGGTYIGSGLFSMAFGYDLTKTSTVYSAADRTAIEGWFSRWADALQTFMDKQAADPIFKNPTGTHTYYWNPNPGLSYNNADYYTGGDCPGRTTPGELAAAIEGHNSTILTKLFDPAWRLAVPNIIHAASAPRNSGDNAGTNPVPQVQIFKQGSGDNPGRGGNVDYMTYNERESTILYEMAASLGKATTTECSEIKTSWTYLGRFFGSGAKAP
ncbi:MAG TPA: alginate lyase family protein, partial [Thermoleophilia bacterium]|nr:alginate lyase family protein [Thermoleophilia bacterium]